MIQDLLKEIDQLKIKLNDLRHLQSYKVAKA